MAGRLLSKTRSFGFWNSMLYLLGSSTTNTITHSTDNLILFVSLPAVSVHYIFFFSFLPLFKFRFVALVSLSFSAQKKKKLIFVVDSSRLLKQKKKNKIQFKAFSIAIIGWLETIYRNPKTRGHHFYFVAPYFVDPFLISLINFIYKKYDNS